MNEDGLVQCFHIESTSDINCFSYLHVPERRTYFSMTFNGLEFHYLTMIENMCMTKLVALKNGSLV